MATRIPLATIQVHETYHYRHGDKPRHTWPDPCDYLQPVPLDCPPRNARLHVNNSTICVPLQLMYSNGNWHENDAGRLHVPGPVLGRPGPDVDAIIIAAIRTEFGITISPGEENLVFVCDLSWAPLRKPINYNDIDTRPGSILVVHFLPKMVHFKIYNPFNNNQHRELLRVQVSAHDEPLEVLHAIHKALRLSPNRAVEFQDRFKNAIEPEWTDYPHFPDPQDQHIRPMRVEVYKGTLPAIPYPAPNNYEAIVQHNWKDVNSDHCLDKLIRPGVNDTDDPPRPHRSDENGQVHFSAFNEYTRRLQEQLARLSEATPHNRRLARRLLQCIVYNRIEGNSNDNDIAEVLTGDVQKARRHLQLFARDYPRGFTTDAMVNRVVRNGLAADAVLRPYKNVYADRDPLGSTGLENLLLYQHILADEDNDEARETQLNWEYV